MVDWSAAAVPRTGADSIWIARRGPRGAIRLTNPATRAEAEAQLSHLLRQDIAKGRRVLAGFDFPFGYPAGTARRLGLTGAPWRAVWDLLRAEIQDGPANANNRFAVAAGLNARLSGEAFPFWGCPARAASPLLGPRRARAHGPGDLPERRHADAAAPRAQPVWKLYTAGSVGSQALMGIPVVARLRDHPAVADRAAIWPFETGLTCPSAPLVLCEIYPSLWCRTAPAGTIKDAEQVRVVVETLAAQDRSARLPELFAGLTPLSAAARKAVEREEAWILGL